MLHPLLHALNHAVLITLFVITMMLAIDVVNVYTGGKWQERLKNASWGQHLLGALFGAVPGCLGSFTIVSMHIHNILRLGAVVTTMVATSGDEAFVMFALFPKTALLLTGLLFVISLITGFTADLLLRGRYNKGECCHTAFTIHKSHERGRFSLANLRGKVSQTPLPFLLLLSLSLVYLGLKVHHLIKGGPDLQNIIFALVLAFLAFITLFSSTHFLKEHLWEHIILKHGPKILLWTFASLLAISLLKRYNISGLIQSSSWSMLLLASLIGLIPDSGPHLLFVMLFAQGFIPFSVLLASSISQDGHAAVPLLAHSRKDFFVVKGINLLAALFFGALTLLLGF